MILSEHDNKSLLSNKERDSDSLLNDCSAQEYALNQYDSVTQVGQFEYKNGAFGLSGDIMLGYKNR